MHVSTVYGVDYDEQSNLVRVSDVLEVSTFDRVGYF